MRKFNLLVSCLVLVLSLASCSNTDVDHSNLDSETRIVETLNFSEPESTTESESVTEPTTESITEPEATTGTEPTESETESESTTKATTETISEVELIDPPENPPEVLTEPEFVEAEETSPPVVTVNNLRVATVSVSCLKVTWDAEIGREYTASVETDAPYQENIYFFFKDNGLLYLTGLREGSTYNVIITPNVKDGEAVESVSATGYTETVEVIYDFDADPEAYAIYKDSGVDYSTDFFAGEKASGLTAQPSSGAIAGAINDPITGTGICRDEYGDYCVAMGQFFGHQWDRYLIEFQNGQQITVKQCDDKGQRWYHTVGGDDTNRNIIEFIWYGPRAPECVMFSGSWGYYNWNGLEMTHVKSIKKINYSDKPSEY